MMVDRDRDDELSAALQRLPREMEPPPNLRENLRANLRATPRENLRTNLRWAVAASLVIAAFAAGRATAPRPAPAAGTDQKFMFLLYGGPSGGGDDRAAEYGAWAVEARKQGRPVSGERLADAMWMAGQSMPEPALVRGFFIVRARDVEEAVELARRHPHARDGTVVVRPVDTP
jgi:hypothetical protein